MGPRTSLLFGCLLSCFSSSLCIASPLHTGAWRMVYNGFGSATERTPASVHLAPKASSRPDETHAALMLSTETEKKPVQNFTLTLRYRIKQQLRKPASTVNPWETLWVFFNYKSIEKAGVKSKKTNYLVLKENGLEIGKAWGEVDQAFLYTAHEPRLKNLEDWHHLTVRKKSTLLSVKIDRQPAHEVKIDASLPIFTDPGAIGLYTEDAHIIVEDISIQNND